MKQKDIVMKSQIDIFKRECLLFLLANIRKLFDEAKLICKLSKPFSSN